MLTDAAARTATGRDKDYKLKDSGGLYLFVTTTGHRSWRLKYRFGGKEKRLVLGTYPAVKITDARKLRDEAKQMLRNGRDPAYERQKAKLANINRHEHTFEKYAREWHELQRDRWSKVHADDVLNSLERDVFPRLGAIAVTDIDEPMVLTTLQAVEERGAIETAHRLRQRMSGIFKFAKAKGAGNGNPTDIAETMKKKPAGRRWPALTTFREIQTLISVVDRAGANPVTKLASRFMALTAQRPGMIRRAPWGEFEGIDWDNPDDAGLSALWRIPADRMKQELELREDEAFEHCVPLAREAVDTLRALHRLTGRGPLAFPNNRSATDPLSENSVGYLYNRLGYKGQHVPHGWRASFSTLMNAHFAALYPIGTDPRMIIERLYIDLMLAHIPAGLSETERKYNRAGYMQQRREIAQLWAGKIMARQNSPLDLLDGPRRPLSRTR
jgi:uncharacterized protein YozE (UPF0346 family)